MIPESRHLPTASPRFPIEPLMPAVLEALGESSRLVLEAPPGAGKTTQVPPALLAAPWLQGRKVIVLEPRRVAARAAAGFMASERGEPVGDTVGYRIRFENKVSARTQIEVVTEGILTRMIQDDPTLEGIGAIVFDEFHERHLSGDLGLALALDVQAQVRDDLRIVVMSATLDGEKLAAFLDAPRLTSAGRSYPVTISHFPARRDEPLNAQLRRCVEQALERHPGDLLVFLPGQREINDALASLAEVALRHAVVLLPLHGDLPVDQQSAALSPDPSGRRRIVLATNVAESSVTLPGVRVVIDAGLAREPRFDPNSGFSRLETVNISQASADQRAGRAGRVAEGWCYRLWPESQRLDPMRMPEIAQSELSSLRLELAAWGDGALRFPDPPPAGAMAAAGDLLQRLGALDGSQRITGFGRRMLALGTHPRLAAMLLSPAMDGQVSREAGWKPHPAFPTLPPSMAVGSRERPPEDPGERALACDLAALVEARDPLRGRRDDVAARWQALAAFRKGRAPADSNRGALAAIDQAAKQWRRRIRIETLPPADTPAHLLGDLLAHAFPERIARQHPTDPRRYQLANGRMAKIFDDSALYGEPWIVASELRFDAKDALVLRAAPVDEARLQRDFPERFFEGDVVRWDAGLRALVSRRERRFDKITLESKPAGRPDPKLAAQALCDAVAELGLDALPWTDALRQWRERLRCLREWMPGLGLPDFSDEALLASREQWLKPAFTGKTRLDALAEDELGDALKSSLDWPLRQKIDQYAPRRITVPSGMERSIEYAFDAAGHAGSPVLAVKLQELFGLADTPRIADGRVPLTLHLLSPGGKPLQVTQDLKGFWDRTYPEVKKEMKGRYPRHPWPEDPWTATASHRAKPRGT